MSRKILCHVGPWSSNFLKVICQGIDEESEVLLSSAHMNADKSDISRRYYYFLEQNKDISYSSSFIDDDIIARCRLLRVLPVSKALLHLNSMREAITELFDEFNPDLVLSETIDSYIMDLFYEECKTRNVKFIGLVASFVNGYFRVSARGEYNKLRNPDDLEIENALKLLETKNYTPAFISKLKKRPYKSILQRWFRNLLKPSYFLLKRHLTGEKYNYHYWASQIVSWQWLHLIPSLCLGDSDWRGQLEKVEKPVIYVPLQMVPEATVDYWCENSEYIDYDSTLVAFINRFSSEFHFLVKEHPFVLGYRHPSLYSSLSKLNNVTICPTNVGSNDIIDLFDSTLVWTGSVGFEAALRGKPVISFCTPYYAKGKMFFEISMDSSSDEILQFINSNKGELLESEKHEMVEYVLSGLLPGRLKFDGSWSNDNPEDLKMALLLGQQIKKL
jgi:hypothetical protein